MTTPPAPDHTTRLRVLICDDAVFFATMLSAWMEGDPEIEVIGITSSAEEGLDAAGRLQPDVVLLDHLLPDGRSPEVVPRLRAQAPGAAIVLTSGLAADLLSEAAAAAGAQGCVSKASSQDEVRAALLRASAASLRPD